MCKIQVGQRAPGFITTAVVDGRLRELTLSAYQEASHWTILLFFPKAWSPVCPTEITAFSHRLEEFVYHRACAVLFASTDSADCLRAWNNTSTTDGGLGGVHMPLISDGNHRISDAYGVLNPEKGVAQRALFIIDPQGIVRAISSNDTAIARNVNEVMRLLDALIFKDEFGEGCAADWQKGDAGVDLKKEAVEGPLTIDAKKSWSEWMRPKFTRAISGPGPRSGTPVADDLTRVSSNERTMLRSNGIAASVPFNGQPSPMHSPKGSDYFTARPSTPMTNRIELQMQQRLENMNAALQNYRQSQEVDIASQVVES